MEINIGNFKVSSMDGTSSVVIGKASFQDVQSNSKTTNGVGSAYGDGSYINMSPYQSAVNDPDMLDMKFKNDNQKLYYNESPIPESEFFQQPPVGPYGESYYSPYRREQAGRYFNSYGEGTL